MRPHGTRTRYVDGPDENDQPGPCRCDDCREANRVEQAAGRLRRLRQQWGAEPPSMVDAEPVRAHVRRLQATGIGWKRIASAAGVPESSMSTLLFGARSRPPSRRVKAATAERILALEPDGLLADGAVVDAAGTRRRVQALVAVGYTISAVGRHLGIAPTNMVTLLRQQHVTERRARAVRELYGRLWDQAPPAASRAQRGAVTRARAMARRNGWPPPAAWDDDLIDLPDADLKAELERRAAAMDDAEVAACHTAHYRHGDISPLVAAGAREAARRRNLARRAVNA